MGKTGIALRVLGFPDPVWITKVVGSRERD